MKKTLAKVLGALTLASALFFVGCSGITQGDMSGDTLFTLEAPKVTAIAYPGQIQATWTKVADAAAYDVQVLADGQEISVTPSGDTVTIPTAVNAVEYTIRVSARSGAANPSRAVSVLDSKYGEAKVKAIVPPAGTSALQLAAYEAGYDGKVKEAKDVLTADKIRVTQDKNKLYVSIQAKAYLNYEIDLVDEYGVLTNTINAANNAASKIIKNDQWIETVLSVPTYGKYTLAVNVTAQFDQNGGVYPADKVVGATYEYKKFEYGWGSSLEANYVDNIRSEGEEAKNAVRLTWSPATYEGKVVPVDMYKVYYRTAYSNELVEVTKAEEKDEEGNVTSPAVVVKSSDLTGEGAAYYANAKVESYYDFVKYYIDTEVADATIAYTYYVVVTKDDSIDSGNATLYPKAADYVTLVTKTVNGNTVQDTVAGTTVNTKIVDNARTNDIEWTIKLDNKYQTFNAYALAKEYTTDGKGYTATPLAEDFDTTTDLASTATTLDGTTFTLIQKDVAEGKDFLLVVVNETGKKSKKVISPAVTMTLAGEPTISANTLSITKYDAEKNALTTTSQYVTNNNDIVVTFTDTIDATKETIATYTYELYKAAVTGDKKVNAAGTGKEYIYEVIGAFTKVEGFAMAASDAPGAAASNTLNYTGIYKEANLAAGKYIYKVVKTNAATGKYAVITKDIVIDELDGLTNNITFNAVMSKNVEYDKEAKTWGTATKAAATQINRITVDASNYIKYLDTNANQTSTSYEDLTTGLTLTLYRAETVNSQTSAVYTKVADLTVNTEEATQTKTDISVNEYDADGKLKADPKVTKDVVTAKQYVYEDTVSTTTGVAYTYILMATKAGYEAAEISIN